MAKYRASRSEKANGYRYVAISVIAGTCFLYLVSGWPAYIITIGLTLAAVLLSILYLKSRSGLLLKIDDRGLEFKEGEIATLRLWSEMRAVRLCITKSDHILTLEMRGKTVKHSLQPYEKRSELIGEIIHHAEPLGLWDLPRDGTRFGLVNHKGLAIFVSAFLGVPGAALLIASFSSGDSFWPMLVLALLLLAAAVSLCLPMNLTYHLRGNELIVTNLGREKRIFLDRPITYYHEGHFCTLWQERTKVLIHPHFDGCENLIWVIRKESEAVRTTSLLPDEKRYGRFRIREMILFAALTVTFAFPATWMVSASYRVLDPVRLTTKEPGITQGWVTKVEDDGRIELAFRVNGQAYELRDFANGSPKVGKEVTVIYQRSDASMGHTLTTNRGGMARVFAIFASIQIGGIVLVLAMLYLQISRRARREYRNFFNLKGMDRWRATK